MVVSLFVRLMRTSGFVMRVDKLQNVTNDTANPITPITGHACRHRQNGGSGGGEVGVGGGIEETL